MSDKDNSLHYRLRIGQWNAQSLVGKWNSFVDLSSEFDIICITETWFNFKVNKRLNNFNLIRMDRIHTSQGGGLAIFLNSSLEYEKIQINIPFFDILACKVYLGDKHWHIFNVYRNSKGESKVQNWEQFFNRIKLFDNIIICGDFNAQHTFWGSEKNTTEGNNFIEAWDKTVNEISILNNGSATRIAKNLSFRSCPDITMISNNLALNANWETFSDSYGSDHLPILITICYNGIIFENTSPRLLIRRLNWKKFIEKLNNLESNFFDSEINSDNFIDNYELLNKLILDSLLDSGAKFNKIVFNSPPPCIWWTPECTAARLERSRLCKNFFENPSDEAYNLYIQSIKNFDKISRRARKNSFKIFCNGLNPQTKLDKIWKPLKAFKNRMLNNNANLDKFSSKNQDLINAFHDLTPNCTDIPFDWESIHDNNSYVNDEIEMNELKHAISISKVKSAPGSDMLTYEVIKFLSDRILEVLLKIFNLILKVAEVPKSWKEYIVKFIPKPQNKGFRPISLAQTLFKIFERIINDRIQHFIEKNKILPPFFFGFRRNRSCTDSTAVLVSDIHKSFVKGENTAAVFLDLVGAYNNVNIEILTRELCDINLPKNIIKIIFEILHDRKLICVFNNKIISERKTSRGLAQGCILSPLLFNLYIHKIACNLHKGVKILGFADDLAIYVSFPNNKKKLYIGKLQKSLDKLNKWLVDRDLQLSPSKSQVCFFSKSDTDMSHSFKLKIGIQIIPVCDKAKFLGVILDCRLEWDEHINYILNKSRKALCVLRTIASIKWGAHPETLITVYKSFIRSILDWGSIFYDKGKANLLLKLDRIQFASLRKALGCMITTPTNVLQHIAGEPPLILRRKYLAKKFLLDSFSKKNKLLENTLEGMSNLHAFFPNKRISFYHSLFKVWENWKVKMDQVEKFDLLPCYQFDYFSNFINFNIDFDIGFKIKNDNNPNELFNAFIQKNYDNFKVIFTDGSRTENQVGCAAHVFNEPQFDIRCKMNDNSSIFTAEAEGIIRALNIAINNEYEKVCICSDSRSVLQCMVQLGLNTHRNPKIYQIKNIMYKLHDKNIKICFIWIPGHCGILGNEMADSIAKSAAANSNVIDNFCFRGDLYSSFKSDLKSSTDELLNKISLVKGSRYFLNIKDKAFKYNPWFKGLRISRNRISLINRIISFHTLTPDHLHDKNILDSPRCECGYLEKSVNHIIWHCPINMNSRLKLINILNKNKLPINININEAFCSKISKKFIFIVCDYILRNNFCI